MKKIMIALMCVFGCMVVSASTETITNVYNFSASLKVPYLENGVRTYKSQALKGYLYNELTDGQTSALWLEVQNNKTKVIHLTEFNSGFYNLIGKTSKASLRTVPSIYYEAADVDVLATSHEAHELITKIQFAGTGALKTVKSVTVGCGACGEPAKLTTYCNILYKMNGYATGVMDCQCPDGEDWWHTVKTTLCGVFLDDNDEVEPQHEAAIWGTWSATFNAKLSDTKLK